MQVLLIVALIFALLVAVFAVQNAGTVAVTFLTWQMETSIVVVILLSAIAGALIAGILGLARQIRLSVRIRTLQGKVAKLEKRLSEYEQENGQDPSAISGRMGQGTVELYQSGEEDAFGK